MRKKIMFLITESDWGGAQRFLIEFIPEFVKLNPHYQITLSAGGQGSLIKELKNQNIKTIHFLNLTQKHFSPFKDIKTFFNIYSLLKKEQPDLLFLLSTKSGFYGAWAAFIFGIFNGRKPKVIYRIGGWAFTENLPWWRRTFYLWLEKISSSLKNIIIVNSKNNYNLALQKNICSKNKLNLIHNGLDIRSFDKNLLNKKTARQKLGVNQTKNMIIGTVANFYKNKGLSTLIKAAKILFEKTPSLKNKFLFVIIGDGPERKSLENEIFQYHLENEIKLLGAYPHARQYFSAFDIFILPSLKEGSPWTILEAMAAKLPIIATQVGGVPELIENEKTGLLIEPASSNLLSQALLELINNQKKRQLLGVQARKKTEKYSLTRMVNEYSEIITRAFE